MDQVSNLNYTWEILKIFVYLGVIIGLIYFLNYFLRKSRHRFGSQNSTIKIIDRSYLSQKNQICLVQVNDKYYLLALTDENVTLLDTLDDLEKVDMGEETQLSSPNFIDVFKNKFGKRGNEDE